MPPHPPPDAQVHHAVLTRVIATGAAPEVAARRRPRGGRERSYGSFTRSFTLPASTAPENAKADLKDGVLTITIPKKPEVQPKKIPVGTSTENTGEKQN